MHTIHGRITLAVACTGLLLTAAVALAQDDAGDLFRNAQRALNHDEFRDAAALFARARDMAHVEENRRLAAETLYWEAFALYRLGARRDLREAQTRLAELAADYDAANLARDAEELAAEIRAQQAQRGEAAAVRELTEEAERLSTLEQNEVKLATLQALIHMRPERAVPLLKKLLARRDELTPEMRQQVLFLLAEQPDEETTDLLIDVARNDPDPEVRGQAVFWLSQNPGERSLAFLDEILRTSDDPEVQHQALFALSEHESDRAAVIMREIARDPDQDLEMRQQAIYWLGEREGEDHLSFLMELFHEVEETQLKEPILFRVAEHGGPVASDWLLRVALDPEENDDNRRVALHWASESGQVPLNKLAEFYRSSDDPEMRETVLFVLSERDDPEALDLMIEIARTEPDVELRKHAIFWLGQTDDPRAEDFLVELLIEE